MEELIRIEVKEGKQLISARELHQFLEVQRDFSNWIKYQIESLVLIENEDFSPILARSEAGRHTVEYALTIEAAKHIAMASRCDKGKQARQYFIEVERRYKEQKLPQLSVLDTLKIAVKELEQKEIIIQEKNKQIEVMKPSHDFVNKVFKATETDIKIGEFAQVAAFADPKRPKTILGQNKLYMLLRVLRIFKSGTTQPMTEYINAGYFVVKEQIKTEINRVFLTTYITPRGQAWLHKRISKHLESALEVLSA